MISPENPYVLPSVVVGATVYLGLSFLTDATVIVRLGVLVGIVGVVPALLNRVFGGSTDDPTSADLTGSTTDDDGTGVADAAVDDADAAARDDDPADGRAT